MGGGGWGSLCRMRTFSQWYEVTEVRLFTLEQYGACVYNFLHFSLSTYSQYMAACRLALHCGVHTKFEYLFLHSVFFLEM